MPKYDVRTRTPERYQKVKEEQMILLKALFGQLNAVRLCPFCDHKLAVLYPGYHGPEVMKCPNCGELVALAAVKVNKSIIG